jgi:7,8-dihydropterin-6-yl-methyl-4-(beta-D-ribofuranosyl)aminobenzene 5'-phosphate synthase
MAVGGQSLDFLRAQHGFSAMVETTVAGRTRRVLFDAGITPHGLIGNLDRLGIPPDTFEAIVFSHGHFDHVMGLDEVARRVGRTNLPVLLHPDFWDQAAARHARGRVRIADAEPVGDAGCRVGDHRGPAAVFLLDGEPVGDGRGRPDHRLRNRHAADASGLAGRLLAPGPGR